MFKRIQTESQQTPKQASDIESELTRILSEELAKQIDKEILRGLGLKERNIRRIDKINKIFSQT
jgi:hypothetical protein